jgi:hypothetical protein
MMRPIWKILIVAGIILCLIVCALVVPHYRAKGAVEAYRKMLKARGEKLTIAELTPSVSAEEAKNGREAVAAGGFAGALTNSPPLMKWISPGRALVGWQLTNLVTDSSTNMWLEFIATIKAQPEITERMAAVLEGGGVAYNLDYSQGFNTRLPHLAPLKRASLWLAGAAAAELHEGDTNGAWQALMTQAELGREYKSEPFIICQLVRIAIAQIGIGMTWEALQYRGWSEEQLAALQTNWESFNLMDQWELTLGMERAEDEIGFKEMRRSFNEYSAASSLYNNFDDRVNQALINPREGIPGILGEPLHYLMWRWWGSYHEELYGMQASQAAMETLRRARTNDAFIPALSAYYETATNILQKNHPGWERQFIFANRVVDIIGRSMLKGAVAETERRMAVTAIALERYRLRHGRYPAAQADLTPDILRKVPIDFMDGKPLRYRRRDDGTFLLYSVGEDGKDSGGDGSPSPTDTQSNKQWYRMQDIIWPAPATADEVKKYEAGMLLRIKKRPPPKVVPAPPTTNSTTH